jgi:hypothetical protein
MAEMPQGSELSITPTPTVEEVAAIAAVAQVALLSGTPAPDPEPVGPSADARWRFSGRWWGPHAR